MRSIENYAIQVRTTFAKHETYSMYCGFVYYVQLRGMQVRPYGGSYTHNAYFQKRLRGEYLRAYVRERQYNAAAAHVSGPLPTERYGSWYVPGPVVYGINPCTLAREPTGGLPEVHVSVPGTTPGYFICTKNNGAFTGGYRSTSGGGQTRLRGWADAAGCIWEAR